MKYLALTALVAAQIASSAAPAIAADLGPDQSAGVNRTGTFAGARLRVPLGATQERAHVGLALTGTQKNSDSGRVRFSKGMELGFAGDDSIRLSVGGKPVSQLTGGGSGPAGPKLGVSTAGWVAIGVGVVAVAVGGLYIWLVSQCYECND